MLSSPGIYTIRLASFLKGKRFDGLYFRRVNKDFMALFREASFYDRCIEALPIPEAATAVLTSGRKLVKAGSDLFPALPPVPFCARYRNLSLECCVVSIFFFKGSFKPPSQTSSG